MKRAVFVMIGASWLIGCGGDASGDRSSNGTGISETGIAEAGDDDPSDGDQGGIGGGHFTPIINRPEVAILGLGRSVLKPVVRDGKIEPRLMMPIAIAYDHRVIDGGAAARFTVELVNAFQTFAENDVKI